MENPRRSTSIWLVILSIGSVQIGSSIGKGTFDHISPTALTWLRLAASALVLALIARPAVRGRTRGDWLVVIAFGTTLGVMNWAFYQSLARIPVGVAVTIEFLGPLSVAVIGSRKARDLLWVALAGVGVTLLGFAPGRLDPVGVAFALLAAGCWAAYIPLSAQTGSRWPGIDGLSVASLWAVALLTPGALLTGHGSVFEPRLIGIGILMSLEPAAAALAAAVILGEILNPQELFAIGCVIVASIGATRSGSPSLVVRPDAGL